MKPNINILVALCSICLWQACLNPTATLADITNWQTGQTIPGTEGITPGPHMYLIEWNTDSHNLRYADFSGGLDLRGSTLGYDWLDFALFTQANVTNASFFGSTLTGADLTGAIVVGATFSGTTSIGFTAAQLYSTASYQNHDLSGICLGDNDLTGWNFAGQNLTNANLGYATLTGADLNQANLTNAKLFFSTLTGADLTNAVVGGASFIHTTPQGFTQTQLYSTASYQLHDLSGIRLDLNNLTGWNFAGENLTNANLGHSTLTGADLNQANLTNANLGDSTLTGADLNQANLTNANLGYSTLTGANLTNANVVCAKFDHTTSFGFTAGQLYSTASYQNHNLSGVSLGSNDLTGWNFAGQDLTHAVFWASTLTDADLTDAVVVGAWFRQTTSRGFTATQLYSTASYQNHDLSGICLGDNDLTGWNFAGQDLTHAGLFGSPLTGADLTGAIVVGASFAHTWAFTPEQLYSTASYQLHDLSGIGLDGNNLTGWNFAGQNLTNARFNGSTLTGADLTGAIVVGATFSGTTSRGFTAAQLYSTASYQNHDLSGIGFGGIEIGFADYIDDLTGWDFSGQNLTNAYFIYSTLDGADLSQANLTNANFSGSMLTGADLSQANLTNANFGNSALTSADLTGADTRGAMWLQFAGATLTNTILVDGRVVGLELGAGQTLVVRDYDGNPAATPPGPPIPIHIERQFVVDAGGMLQMNFDADAWDSTISFDSAIPVMLGGSLGLDFALGVDQDTQIGRTFDLFDWTGVTPSGAFDVASPYSWDLSQLYTRGDVTLLAIPEPTSVVAWLLGTLAFALLDRRRRHDFGNHDMAVDRLSTRDARITQASNACPWIVPRWRGAIPGERIMNHQIYLRSFVSVQSPFVLLFIACCFFASTEPMHAQVTFDWATVGNPGNGPDQDYGGGPFGAVSYTYRISKHEVTNAQYTKFLNAVDPTGANPNLGGDDPFLYNSLMSATANGGINFDSGAPNGSKYQLKSGRGNNPVIFVSFFDAMRFTNWLQNGQGTGSTESGVYTIGNGVNETR